MKFMLKLVFLFFFLGMVVPSSGQIRVDVKRKIESKVNQRLNRKVDKAINQGLDAVEEGIKGGDSAKDAQGKKPAGGQKVTRPDGGVSSGEANEGVGGRQSVKQTPTGVESFSGNDLSAGEQLLFFEDFSQEGVGDFPELWNSNGSAEVVTTRLSPGKWMKFVMNECVWIDELLELPESYTIEYDVIPIGGLAGEGMSGWQMKLMEAEQGKAWESGSAPGIGGFQFRVEASGTPGYHTWLNAPECAASALSGSVQDKKFKQKINQKYHIAIRVEKTRIRIFQDGNKIFDLPKAFSAGCVTPDRISFENGAAMISNFSIAVGAPGM